MPPYWYIAVLAFLLCGIALGVNFNGALIAAASDENGTLAIHCALMAWLLVDITTFALFTSRMVRKWRALRRDWEELHRMREELERAERGRKTQ